MPELAGCAVRRGGPRRWSRSTTTPPDTTLAAAGVALRLRRIGRRWVQTVKRQGRGTAANGLFSHRETRAPGARRAAGAGRAGPGRRAGGGARGGGRRAARAGLRDAGAADESSGSPRPAAARSSWRSTRARSWRGRRARRSARRSSSCVSGEVGRGLCARAAALPDRAGPLGAGEQVRARLPAGAGRAWPTRRRGRASAGAPRFERRGDGRDGGPRRAARLPGADRRQHGGRRRQRRASRGRTSSGSGCGGCAPPSRSSARASARPPMAPLAATAQGTLGGWWASCATPTS